MSASLDTAARFRTLLETQRADCVHQREDALAECAQSVPDPVAQRRAADLQVTIGEIDAALGRIEAGTVRQLRPVRIGHSGGATRGAPLRRPLRRLHRRGLTVPQNHPARGAVSAE